jgi:Glycosyltransferase family 87
MSVLTGLAMFRGVLDGIAYQHSNDPALFSAAALRLVSSRWADTFADGRIQIGPLAVAFHSPIALFSRVTGLAPVFALSVLSAVIFTLGALFVFRRLLADVDRSSPQLEMFVGLVVIIGGLSWAASTSGHPEEGFIALLWLLAARSSLQGRSVTGGALIGVATALKLSGALGIALLLLDPSWRRRLGGGALAAVIAVAAYAPFIALGDFQMFSFDWAIRPQSPLGFFIEPESPFTWRLRLVQTAVVLGVSAVLIRAHRKISPSLSAWAIPAGIIASRMLTDPLDYHYYWLPMGTVLLLGLSSFLPDEVSWRRVPLAAGFYLTIFPFFLLTRFPLRIYITGLCVSVLALVASGRNKWFSLEPHEQSEPEFSSPERENA